MKLNEFMTRLAPEEPEIHELECADKGTAPINHTADLGSDLSRADIIPKGRRNSTLSHFAGRVLKRYGDTAEAYEAVLAKAAKCSPPLEEKELKTIYNSARGFRSKLEKQEGYIPPEAYNSDFTLRPDDYSDVGQAEVLAFEYGNELRYSPATDYIRYNGIYWEESKPKAQAAAQELTARQLEEARKEIKKTWAKLEKVGVAALLVVHGSKKARSMMNSVQSAALSGYEAACDYRVFVIKRRESKNITAALKEARPMLEIAPKDLDSDGFLLNTPIGTYDLRLGMSGLRPHDPSDFITKVTSVSPGQKGAKLWQDALNLFFSSDEELIEYVQLISGLGAIGKVFVEILIISYGDGRNGKSTFWNTSSRVLGSYSGNISADTLTIGCRRNVKPELAEAKGKRLLIAAELEEGTRLNTSNVKQLCSTDEIFAEKKYKEPFSYIPSHTLVLYTNHLPRVGANDPGTWRRLVVIPFNAKIEGGGDVKNYADYLFENAGEAALAWIIEGARKVIAKDFKIEPPKCVKNAIAAYRDDNDWLAHFIAERCETGAGCSEKSGDL
jgi:P4 family phage/plasmid primase-like protien